MRCPACAEDVEDGADLCLACGEPLSSAMRRVAPPSPSAQLAQPAAESLQSELLEVFDEPPSPAPQSKPRIVAPFRPVASTRAPTHGTPLSGPAAVVRERRRRDEDDEPRCLGCGVRNPLDRERCRGCGDRIPRRD